MTTTSQPLTYSPYAYEIHDDPYPVYARLRAEAPLYRNEALDFWALSRHEDVLAAFRNVDGYSNAYGVSLDPSAFRPDAHKVMSFLALDPPRHTRMRSLIGKGFTPSKVAQMEDRIRAIAVEHLDVALERGSFDFIADFAGKLPMDVISELVGVPGSTGRRSDGWPTSSSIARTGCSTSPRPVWTPPCPWSSTTRGWSTNGGPLPGTTSPRPCSRPSSTGTGSPTRRSSAFSS